MNRSRGTQRVHVLKRVAEHLLVKEGDRVKGLVLGAGGDVPFQGQISQEPLQFLFAGQGGRHVRQSAHVAPQPVHVAFLDGQRFVLPPNDFPRPTDRFGHFHDPPIYEPPVA